MRWLIRCWNCTDRPALPRSPMTTGETPRRRDQATGLAPTNDLESAILVTLPPGNYTAIVQGKNDTSGVGLVEVYDLSGHLATG